MKYTFRISLLAGILLSIIARHGFAQVNHQARTTIDTRYAPFYHGVASGDPLTDRVLLWTRVTTDTTGPISVDWAVATDTLMSNIVSSGVTTTDSTVDWTIKVDAAGLQPNSWYYYQFDFNGRKSIVGRTRTVPVNGVDSLRFAVVSCAKYEAGFFNAYGRIAERNDVDAILHLGDYIYEGGTSTFGTSIGRPHDPSHEILTLEDYRIRLSQHHLDEELRYAHQQYPWITVWDDHESANDSWSGGAENHDPANEGPWVVRKANSIQAYLEWLPVRQPDTADHERIYRSYAWGDLLNFHMLDTRLEGRDEQLSPGDPLLGDTSRTILGTDQMAWLKNQLLDTTAQWKILGQQVMVAPLEVFGYPINTDQWDGYPYDRERVLNYIMNNSIEDVVVLTGDIHTSWANDLPAPGMSYNSSTGAGSAAVEFVTPSVTSTNSTVTVGTQLIQLANPHIKFIDLDKHGYVLLHVTRDYVQSDWYFMNTVDNPNRTDSWETGWYVLEGERHLRRALAAAPSPVTLVPPAPLDPPNLAISVESPHAPIIFSASPNPFNSEIMLEYYNAGAKDLMMRVINPEGKTIWEYNWKDAAQGLIHHRFDFGTLPAGIYFLQLEADGKAETRKIIKAH